MKIADNLAINVLATKPVKPGGYSTIFLI